MYNTLITEKESRILPYNLFSVGTIQQIHLYSSYKLQEEYIEMINTSDLLKPSKDILIKLVKSWAIVPCFTQKNLLDWFISKMKNMFSPAGFVAFYAPSTNRVYVPFDTQMDITFKPNHKYMSLVLIHEMQHFASVNLKQSYYSLFSNMYSKWYSVFFNSYLQTDRFTSKEGKIISLWLSKNFEWDSVNNSKWWPQYQLMMNKISDKINLDKIKVTSMFSVIKMFLETPSIYFDDLISKKEPVWSVFLSCKEAYKLMRIPIQSIPIQELYLPSEISCTAAEVNPLPVHYKSINMCSKLNIKPLKI